MKHPRDQWALPIIVGVYLLLGLAYSLVNPVLESPDELLNYENIRYLVEQRKLPVLQPGEFSKAHHPPLYYVLSAVISGWVPNETLEDIAENDNPYWGFRIYDQGVDNKSQFLHRPELEGWPFRGAVLGIRLLRLVSIFMGGGVIIVVYLTTYELFTDEPALAWGAASLAAFNPMFLFIQSSVHNDALTNLLAALTLLGVVRYWTRGPSTNRALFLGVVAGLGILTKITFLFLGPVVVLVIVVRSWRERYADKHWWRTALSMLLIGGGVVLLVAGWWFARNQVLYGDLTSMRLQASIWQPREQAPDWTAAINELDFLRDSFWGAFGFGQIPLHRPVYTFLWVIEIIAAGGLLLWAVRARRTHGTYRVSGLLLSILLAAPLTAFLATFGRMTVSGSANFGRYLFTTYAVIAPLMVLGLTEWIPGLRRRLFLGVLSILFFTLAVYALLFVLRPAYAVPPTYESVEQLELEHLRDDSYPGLARLIGYDISPASAVPDERFDVTLYWQVTDETDRDMSLFVQLVNYQGERVAGRDTHPGLGRYPTSRWRAGEIIKDTIPLYIPKIVSGPQGLHLNVGLRNEEGRLLQTAVGQDTITLDTIRLAGSIDSQYNDTAAKYLLGGLVELVSIDPPEGEAKAGEMVPFTLIWRAVAPPAVDYVVFIHLVDNEGNQIVTYDQPPAAGSFPTRLWQQGDTVIDSRLIQLPGDLLPGLYHVLVGWYRLDDLTRLPVVDEQGEPVANAAIPIFSLKLEK
ncbi:MAG: glycosyltransferase family 39 protein [Candidatus Promineifilaceae bacterium]|nr:glycosyltransferase family 39 protein [Candidatus Promineifilaceae bacterium]